MVFGISSMSNAGKKIVIVQGVAEHCCTFHTYILRTITPNTTANHTVAN